MSDCLFCSIVEGKIPCEKVFENENVLAFKDIYPQAKIHILFIHKNHSTDITQMDLNSIGEVFSAIKEYVDKNPKLTKGFRIVNNCGQEGAQTVFHTHFHLLAGEQLKSFGA
ncbi:MAG: HIT domain-containing protein [Bacteriovoracaceae bacterium]|jgi:histidine triad (HIT) family protein|nr:HIT domain-containing protein [Bacteriovoracaceae bacterium]